MKIARIAGAAALGVLVVGQAKAEVTGGELRFGHERFLDDVETASGDETFTRTSLEGSLEVGVAPGAALQFDLGLDRAGVFDDTGTNAAVHGIYRFGTGAVGLFLGRDDLGDGGTTFYGIEGKMEFDRVALEGYALGTKDDGSILGLRGGYLYNADWTLGGRVESGSFNDDIDITRVGLTADLVATPGTTISAELGHADFDFGSQGSFSEPYVGIQATVAFGVENGTAFSRRGVLDLLPGF